MYNYSEVVCVSVTAVKYARGPSEEDRTLPDTSVRQLAHVVECVVQCSYLAQSATLWQKCIIPSVGLRIDPFPHDVIGGQK